MHARDFAPVALADYELGGSGGGEKLERFGPVWLRRPDPQAMWARALDERAWQRAELSFVRESDRGGRWEPRAGGRPLPERWELRHGGARLLLKPTPFKHIGVFPEQSGNWAFVASKRSFKISRKTSMSRCPFATGAFASFKS